jgi:hypothetical protein
MAEQPSPQTESRSPPRFSARLNDAIPAASTVLFGSALWGIAMAGSALVGLYVRDGLIIFSKLAVISLFFYGPAVGFAPGLFLANLICGRAAGVWRFVIGTIILALATHTATAALFALQYRVFYAHWHAEFLSVTWCFQLVFTSIAAVYQFTVDSLYVYFPVAPLLFLGLGLWFARRAH